MQRGDDDAGLDLMARQREKEKLINSKREALLEFGLDSVDIIAKTYVISTYSGDYTEILITLYSLAVALVIVGATTRVLQFMDMNNVVTHGYSKHWKKKARIQTAPGEEDPRIARDGARRMFAHYRFRSIQAFGADLPWVITNVYRMSDESDNVKLALVLSICIAGFGFGVKFASFLAFIKSMFRQDQKQNREDVYEVLPADVTVGVGHSIKENTIEAIAEAYKLAKSRLGKEPSFCLVTMTADHDHEAGLARFVELAPETVFCGGTTCQGVMVPNGSVRDNNHVVAVWAMADPEGHYAVDIFSYDDVEDLAKLSAKKASFCSTGMKEDLYKKGMSTLTPSFVWLTSAPGPEDRLLQGMMQYFGDTPLIGGSSADNDITGKWKQWCSSPDGKPARMESNGCSFCVAYCSAVVQSQLFTGYNATGKKGIVTKTDGLRHILEIDGRPASQVYNEWTGGEFSALLADKSEDSNILGPSSLYPLGQMCGEDEEGEVFYRSIHPHLLKKETNSVTLFSDVKTGEEIVMMSGTKENVVNRIAGVSSHIVRSSGFSLQELRGSLVIFCAGCMMFASDQMDQAASKLNTALGGIPFLGVHTFGEQGQFADGVSRHGNLMFSALVISSRRRTMKLLNVDSGKMVSEDDPAFMSIVGSGNLK